MDTAEVTEEDGVDAELDMFSVFPAEVSVELGAVNICDVVRGV